MNPSPLLRDAIFWIAAILCVIGEIAILRSMHRGSRALAPDRSPAVDTPVPRGTPATELVSAVLPAVGLIVLLVLTLRAMT